MSGLRFRINDLLPVRTRQGHILPARSYDLSGGRVVVTGWKGKAPLGQAKVLEVSFLLDGQPVTGWFANHGELWWDDGSPRPAWVPARDNPKPFRGYTGYIHMGGRGPVPGRPKGESLMQFPPVSLGSRTEIWTPGTRSGAAATSSAKKEQVRRWAAEWNEIVTRYGDKRLRQIEAGEVEDPEAQRAARKLAYLEKKLNAAGVQTRDNPAGARANPYHPRLSAGQIHRLENGMSIYNPSPSPPIGGALQKILGDPDVWWSFYDDNQDLIVTTDKSEAREETRRLGGGVFWEHRKKWPRPDYMPHMTDRPIFVDTFKESHPWATEEQVKRQTGRARYNPRRHPELEHEYLTARRSLGPEFEFDFPRSPYPYEIPGPRKAPHWESSHRTPETSSYRKPKKDKRSRRKEREMAQRNPSPEVKAMRAKYRKQYGNDWWKDPKVKAAYKAELAGSAPAAPTKPYKPKPYTVEAEAAGWAHGPPPAPPEVQRAAREVAEGPFRLSGHLKPRKPRKPREPAADPDVLWELAGGFRPGDILSSFAYGSPSMHSFAIVLKRTPKTLTLQYIASHDTAPGGSWAADRLMIPVPSKPHGKPFRVPYDGGDRVRYSRGHESFTKWDGSPVRVTAYMD